MTQASPQSFDALVRARFHFLESRGFQASAAADRATAVSSCVAYLGRHVGFLVSLDARDGSVDVRVVRVVDGAPVEWGDRGYSRNLLAHLIEREGYRGAGRSSGTGSSDPVDAALAAWADLLEAHGGGLLEDRESALP